jgi:hypothetical protein
VSGRADDLLVGRDRDAHERAEARPLVLREIPADQDPTRLGSKLRIAQARLELGVEFGVPGQQALGRGPSVLAHGRPAAIALKVKEGISDVGGLGPAVRDDLPVGGELEGELRRQRQHPLGQQTLLREFDDHEHQQGLVRRRIASGYVNPELVELREPSLFAH